MITRLLKEDFLDLEPFSKIRLTHQGPYTQHCIQKGLKTFKDVCQFIKALPYGRIDAAAPYLDVLAFGKGTCSSKHACLTEIGKELGLEIELLVIIFWMTEQTMPQLAKLLDKSPFDAIPEAHCLCRLNRLHIDVTFDNNLIPDFGDLIHYQTMTVTELRFSKVPLHKEWIKKVMPDAPLDQVWAWRERCIEALG